ncbi:MAG: asparaginase [Anaerolineales bacterium]|nr:asparaginase [Anaerolineales bacterium]
MAALQPLLELTRGRIIESTHFGSIAVVDSNGRLLHSYGDPYGVAFLRSSAKPFQALPFVERGGVEHFNFTQRELSLACSSHDTAEIHLETVKAMQAKVGIQESDLQCGTHLPSDASTLKMVIQQGITPTPNFNNCSGKHTAMLAHAKMRGLPLENYLSLGHPIQQDILTAFSEMCEIEKEKVELGVDGCSAPNFAVPLLNAALGMAHLCDPSSLNQIRARACREITSAMTTYPEMISNDGEFDCELMKTGSGKIVTKRGAEGFQIIGLLPGVYGENGVGIAFKVMDGDASRMNDALESSSRVRPAITLEILRQLKALNETQLQSLAKFGPKKQIKNHRGILTGESYPVFELA